jgi:hypothetical protein
MASDFLDCTFEVFEKLYKNHDQECRGTYLRELSFSSAVADQAAYPRVTNAKPTPMTMLRTLSSPNEGLQAELSFFVTADKV